MSNINKLFEIISDVICIVKNNDDKIKVEKIADIFPTKNIILVNGFDENNYIVPKYVKGKFGNATNKIILNSVNNFYALNKMDSINLEYCFIISNLEQLDYLQNCIKNINDDFENNNDFNYNIDIIFFNELHSFYIAKKTVISKLKKKVANLSDINTLHFYNRDSSNFTNFIYNNLSSLTLNIKQKVINQIEYQKVINQIEYQNVEEPQLQYQNIEEPQLQYQNIEEPQLQYQNIEEPQLQYQNIEEPQLQYQNIEEPQLQYQNIEEPQLQYQNIEEPQLQYQNIEETQLQYQNIEETQLQYQNIEKTDKEYLIPIVGKYTTLCNELTKQNLNEHTNNIFSFMVLIDSVTNIVMSYNINYLNMIGIYANDLKLNLNIIKYTIIKELNIDSSIKFYLALNSEIEEELFGIFGKDRFFTINDNSKFNDIVKLHILLKCSKTYIDGEIPENDLICVTESNCVNLFNYDINKINKTNTTNTINNNYYSIIIDYDKYDEKILNPNINEIINMDIFNDIIILVSDFDKIKTKYPIYSNKIKIITISNKNLMSDDEIIDIGKIMAKNKNIINPNLDTFNKNLILTNNNLLLFSDKDVEIDQLYKYKLIKYSEKFVDIQYNKCIIKTIIVENNNLVFYNFDWTKHEFGENKIFEYFVENNILPYNYFAFPWDSYIKGKYNNSAKLNDVINKYILEKSNSYDNYNYFTVVNNLLLNDFYLMDLLNIFTKLNINTVFVLDGKVNSRILNYHKNIKFILMSNKTNSEGKINEIIKYFN
jgi:hypothetical protein